MERGLNLQGHVEGAARDVPIPLASLGADCGTQAGEKAWDLDTSQRGATPPFQANLSYSRCRRSLSRPAPESVA